MYSMTDSLEVRGKYCFSGSGDGMLYVHDIQDDKLLYALGANEHAVRWVHVHHAHACHSNCVRRIVWNVCIQDYDPYPLGSHVNWDAAESSPNEQCTWSKTHSVESNKCLWTTYHSWHLSRQFWCVIFMPTFPYLYWIVDCLNVDAGEMHWSNRKTPCGCGRWWQDTYLGYGLTSPLISEGLYLQSWVCTAYSMRVLHEMLFIWVSTSSIVIVLRSTNEFDFLKRIALQWACYGPEGWEGCMLETQYSLQTFEHTGCVTCDKLRLAAYGLYHSAGCWASHSQLSESRPEMLDLREDHSARAPSHAVAHCLSNRMAGDLYKNMQVNGNGSPS